MLLYNRYIFNKVFVTFLAFITIFVTLIWFSRAITFVKYVTENGVELSQFFYLFILILPWLLLFIIPVSLFAAILLTYNRLITNNEISILKNAGLSKITICKSTILLGILLSVLCFLIAFFLMPYANKELRISRNNFSENYASLSFNPKTFETLKQLTIYTKNRDKTNQLYGILLHDKRASDYSITITAKSGYINSQNNSALLYMKNGTVQKLNYATNLSEILHFDDYVFNLTENNKGDVFKRWKAKERYFGELINPNDDSEPDDLIKYRTELNQRFTYPLLSMVFTVIALGAILHGNFSRRGNVRNIISAIVIAVIFFGLILASYNIIEISPQLTPLLYLIFAISIIFGVKILREK